MTFDNARFERDIAQSIKSLGDLKHALNFTGVKQSFEDLGRMSALKMSLDTSQFVNSLAESQRGIQRISDQLNFGATSRSFNHFAEQTRGFNLNGITSAISGVSGKFLAMSTLAVTALATIASAAIRVGTDMATAFTTDPIIQGFQEMETNMNSIQTILANTASKGSTLEDVNNALSQLNEYSDRTIYNFAQMARNIGTFTAAGVDLDTSVNAIKGIANLAAISGSSADQASTAMYQLSQALATGSVKLMDWNSVVNAGMGGEVFKNALFETGKALGTIADIPMDMTLKEWEDAGNNFRESLQDGWITGEVLTTTLQSFTGDLTQAQLMSLGYTEEQAIEMEKLGKLGNAAATEVKTLTQLLGTVKETMGSGWSRSFQLIFGDFEEAKATFTEFNDIISGVVNVNADARNALLENWRDLGGRTRLIEGLKAAFESMQRVINTIGGAFRNVFGSMDADKLYDLTNRFATFFETLATNDTFFYRLRAGFDAIFQILDFGIEVVKGTFGVFRDLFSHFIGGDSDTLLTWFDKITAAISEFYTAWINNGDFSILRQEFEDITEVLIEFGDKVVEIFRDPTAYVDGLRESFKNFFDGIDFNSLEGVEEAFGRIRDKISEVLSSISIRFNFPEGLTEFFQSFSRNVDENTTNSLSGGFGRVSEALETMWDVLQRVWNILTDVGNAFQWVWDKVKAIGDIVGDVFGAIWDFAITLGPTLQEAFMSEEFDKFLDILDSIGILLGGAGLAKLGSSGIAVNADLGLGGVTDAIKAFQNGPGIIGSLKTNLDQLTSTLQTMQTQIRANALLDIAKALALLTASVLVLSFINPESMAKSLTALAVGMGQLIGAVAILNASSGKAGLGVGLGLASIGATMVEVAAAVLVLSAAVVVLSKLSWEEIAKGLLTTTVLMGVMVSTATLLSGSSLSLIAAGLGMMAISVGLVIMGAAMKIFATLSWEEIGKGLTSVAGLLIGIAAAMHLMPAVQMLLIAPALLGIATALNIMGGALLIFASMSWEEIGKGMTVLAGGLLIIAGAMQLMPLTSVLNGPALIAVAVALGILAGVLKIFATMSWDEIGRAMATLGGSMLILAGGLTLMSGTIPGAIALGIAAGALLLLGKSIVGFSKISWKDLGTGLAVMAVALAAIAAASLLMAPTIPAILGLSVALLALGAGFALLGVGSALMAEAFQIIAAAGTAGIDTFMYLLDQALERVPQLISIFTDAVIQIVQQLLDALPAMINSLSGIIRSILDLLIENIPGAVETVVVLLREVLVGIKDLAPDFVSTGFTLLMEFLNGIKDNIRELTSVVATIAIEFIKELTSHVPELVDAGLGLLVAFLKGIADNLSDVVEAGIDIFEQLLIGIAQNIDDIADAVGEIVTRLIAEIGELAGDIAQAGVDALIEFLSGLAEDIPEIVENVGIMVTNILDALADAFIAATDRMAIIVIDFLNDLAEVIRENDDELSDAFANLGAAIIEGMIVGLVASQPKLVAKLGEMAAEAIKAAAQPWKWGSPSKLMIEMGNDIIRGQIIGLEQLSPRLNRSITGISESAVDTFHEALSKASYGMEKLSEFNPTITPVLDLSQVQATARGIGGIIGPNAITAGVSVDQANLLATQAAQAQDVAAQEQTPEAREVKFEQHNYSPEALNTAKIYKQTRSLIEVTKKELENA